MILPMPSPLLIPGGRSKKTAAVVREIAPLEIQDAFPRGPVPKRTPRAFYLAMRWDYARWPKQVLRHAIVRLTNPANALHVFARPVDFGPGDGSIIDGQPTPDTGRIADLSPGAATALGLQTDEVVMCELVG